MAPTPFDDLDDEFLGEQPDEEPSPAIPDAAVGAPPGAPPGEPRGPESAAGRGLIPDGVKKALLAGVGALFMTEEGARRLARDWKLPKDVIGFVGQQAQGAKEEILRVLSDEIRRFLESDVVRREIGKQLEGMAIEVNAEIRFRPVDGGAPRPEVRARVSPRARRPRKRK